MSRLRVLLIPLAAVGLAGCGGSPTGPSPGPTPSSTPPSGNNSLTALVFYDENGNGVLDGSEAVRLPGVTVSVAGHSSVSSQGGGRAVVSGLPGGSQVASIQADTLPPYYRASAPVTVSLPQPPGAEAALPATLPIGNNRPNRYLGFGDSITLGEGSSDGNGYRTVLSQDLRAYWGQAEVVHDGISGSRSGRGVERIAGTVGRVRPAYTLILYGTNDWNDLACRDAFPCDTIDNIRSMIRTCRAASSLPVVGTIIPVNPIYVDRDAVQRNQWVASMNELLRSMARQEGALVADLHAVFLREPSLASLFVDRLHPNDRGYQIMAREWVRALITPMPGLTAMLFREPG